MAKQHRDDQLPPDVRADEPERAMQHFTEGLRRVLTPQKPESKPKRKKRTAKPAKPKPERWQRERIWVEPLNEPRRDAIDAGKRVAL